MHAKLKYFVVPICLAMLAGLQNSAEALPLAAITNSPAPQARDSKTYIADVDFLLTEFGTKAGTLLKKKGIDWGKVSAQFREESKSVSSDAAYINLCQRLIARLQDGHAGFVELKIPMPGDQRQSGPQVHLLEISNRVFIRQSLGAAAQKGLRPGMEVVELDHFPARKWLDQRLVQVRDTQGYSTDHQARYAVCHWGLGDVDGSSLELGVVQGDTNRTVSLTRQGGANFVPVGPIFPPMLLRGIGRQSYGKTRTGYGYIHLRDIPTELPEQLDKMLEALGAMPGVILDMRANGGGGCDHGAVFGRFVPAGTTWRETPSAGTHPYSGPMVVIVDAGTRSAGETVAGMFKEAGRAYVIGDGPSAGTSSGKDTIAVPSGLFTVRFSIRSNGRSYNNGQGIEGIGIPPHEIVPYDPAELLKGVDTQIRRAEELLKNGLPADKVPFTSNPTKS